MNYFEFLDTIIDDGLKEVEEAYKDKPHKLKGAREGFLTCRGKHPADLYQLMKESQQAARLAHLQTKTASQNSRDETLNKYWELRYYAAQIEWVSNCISVLLQENGQRIITPPTARAYMKAAAVLGVASGAN